MLYEEGQGVDSNFLPSAVGDKDDGKKGSGIFCW